MKKNLLLSLLFSIIFFNANHTQAQEQTSVPVDSVKTPEEHRFGFIDVNAYYDTRHASTITINYLALLSKRLSYFSFVNFQQSAPGDVQHLNAFDFFYTEHNLTYTPFKKIPIDVNVQLVMLSLPNSTKLRFAPSWRIHDTPVIDKFFKSINLKWGINFHVVQLGYNFPLNDFTWQMEHFYKLDIAPKLLNNRLYISGFADHTMGGPIAKGLVMEHQAGLRLFDNFYAVAEYRHFSYFPTQYRNGWGLGLEYLVVFK